MELFGVGEGRLNEEGDLSTAIPKGKRRVSPADTISAGSQPRSYELQTPIRKRGLWVRARSGARCFWAPRALLPKGAVRFCLGAGSGHGNGEPLGGRDGKARSLGEKGLCAFKGGLGCVCCGGLDSLFLNSVDGRDLGDLCIVSIFSLLSACEVTFPLILEKMII